MLLKYFVLLLVINGYLCLLEWYPCVNALMGLRGNEWKEFLLHQITAIIVTPAYMPNKPVLCGI